VRPAALLAAAALTLSIAACAQDPNSISAQAKAGDRKGYVSGDGSVEKIASGTRQEPVKLTGTTLEGRKWSTADASGKVVVINVWGSWCGPCGVLILALQGKAPTVPTTLVLDKSGRIAARVNGQVTASTLTGLVDDVLAEA